METESNLYHFDIDLTNQTPDSHPLQLGDNDAWAQFIQDNGNSFMRTAFRSGARSVEDAEDACQTGLLKLFELRAKNTFENPKGFVHSVVKNYSVDLSRKYTRRRTYSEHEIKNLLAFEGYTTDVDESPLEKLPDPSQCPEEIAIHNTLMEEVISAIEQLPLAQREVVLFTYNEGLSQKECAARMNIPHGTVKARIHRGIAALSTLLTPPNTGTSTQLSA